MQPGVHARHQDEAPKQLFGTTLPVSFSEVQDTLLQDGLRVPSQLPTDSLPFIMVSSTLPPDITFPIAPVGPCRILTLMLNPPGVPSGTMGVSVFM